jgi:hypothetical protein
MVTSNSFQNSNLEKSDSKRCSLNTWPNIITGLPTQSIRRSFDCKLFLIEFNLRKSLTLQSCFRPIGFQNFVHTKKLEKSASNKETFLLGKECIWKLWLSV